MRILSGLLAYPLFLTSHNIERNFTFLPTGGEGEGGWEVDDDLDLPEDLTSSGGLLNSGSGQGEDGYFVPPPRGQPVTQGWSQRSQLAVDHVLAGSFESACRLLNDQVSIF